jgi:hypothetical protein
MSEETSPRPWRWIDNQVAIADARGDGVFTCLVDGEAAKVCDLDSQRRPLLGGDWGEMAAECIRTLKDTP